MKIKPMQPALAATPSLSIVVPFVRAMQVGSRVSNPTGSVLG